MRDFSIRLGLLVLLLPTMACDKLFHKDADAGADAAVDAGAIADAAAEASTDDSDGGPAPTLDAGTTTAVHTGPAGLVGTYEGGVKEGPTHYGMTAVLANTSGTISYSAPFDCKGTWTFVSHNPATKTWTYKEHITVQSGKRKCTDGETATIVETAPSVFAYSEGNAHATLSKTK